MSERTTMSVGRRQFLAKLGAAGSGAVLASFATGIPAKIFLSPLTATAAQRPEAKVLILSADSGGGPLNANAPGTYETGFTDIVHPGAASMTATDFVLGEQATRAAKPWADLPQSVLDTMCFLHHATYTSVHGDHGRVMRVMGQTADNEMFVSALARELQPALGSVQADPISLGASSGELLSTQGRLIGNVAPTSVAQALGGVQGPLANLQALRDASIDRLYNLYREQGTPSQLELLDRWVRSRDDVRKLGTSLLSRLEGITDDGEQMQVRTAAVLAAMSLAPVITVHLDFGGDNHRDAGLAREAASYPTAVANIGVLAAELEALRAEGSLPHDVVFANLNVFGRTLKRFGDAGRDHHAGHHTMVLMGTGVAPGVVGGIKPNTANTEYIARTIDSATGAATDSGDIAFEDSLASAARTLATLVGVAPDRLDAVIPAGTVIQAALADPV